MACYQQTVQKLASMIWGCISTHGIMGNLHIFEGTMLNDTGFGTYAASRQHLFQ